MSTSKKTFWQFSLKTYRRAGVEHACLVLQDRYGADVNLLLFCCWAGRRGITVDKNTFTHILDFSQDWSRYVVHPLRSVRRWMKADGCGNELVDFQACMDLRERVKAVELHAEKQQQSVLESLLQSAPCGGQSDVAGSEAAAANLCCYFDSVGIAWSDEVRSELRVILRAAFPGESVCEPGE